MFSLNIRSCSVEEKGAEGGDSVSNVVELIAYEEGGVAAWDGEAGPRYMV